MAWTSLGNQVSGTDIALPSRTSAESVFPVTFTRCPLGTPISTVEILIRSLEQRLSMLLDLPLDPTELRREGTLQYSEGAPDPATASPPDRHVRRGRARVRPGHPRRRRSDRGRFDERWASALTVEDRYGPRWPRRPSIIPARSQASAAARDDGTSNASGLGPWSPLARSFTINGSMRMDSSP